MSVEFLYTCTRTFFRLLDMYEQAAKTHLKSTIWLARICCLQDLAFHSNLQKFPGLPINEVVRQFLLRRGYVSFSRLKTNAPTASGAS